eukprot:1233264-Rhodomonas_salina.1
MSGTDPGHYALVTGARRPGGVKGDGGEREGGGRNATEERRGEEERNATPRFSQLGSRGAHVSS